MSVASSKFVRTLSSFFLVKRLCSHKEPFLRPRGSGKLLLPIHRMEELCQQRSPRWFQARCVITIKMKDNLTQRFIGSREGRYCWKLSQNMEQEISQKKTLASTHPSRKQQDEVRVLWGFPKFFGLPPSNSRTLWWNSNWPWVDVAHSNSSQLEGIYFSQVLLFFQHPIYPGERTHSRWKGKHIRATDYPSSRHSILSEGIPMKKNPVMTSQLPRKCTITAIGNEIRMPFIG